MEDARIVYATKRDINGNRKKLVVDYSRAEYSTASRCMIDDYITVKAGDLKKIKAAIIAAGYAKKETL